MKKTFKIVLISIVTVVVSTIGLVVITFLAIKNSDNLEF